MDTLEFELWEPEESVGKLWHSFASRLDAPEAFDAAAATLEETRGRLGVLFRGLGGGRDVEIRPAMAQESLSPADMAAFARAIRRADRYSKFRR